jgi:prevent-host-death family protein
MPTSAIPTATIRDLRNRFPEIRRIVEAEGEIIITEKGKGRYKLIPYDDPGPAPQQDPRTVDYAGRMAAHGMRPLSKEESEAFWEDFKGTR